MRLFILILISGLAILFLSSCRQDEKVELNQMQGGMVVLKVGIDGIEEKVPGSSKTKSGSVDSLIAISDLGDGLLLESRLTGGVSIARTKFGAGNNLDPSSKILALVYKTDGTPYKYQYLSTSKAEILLPPGHAFKIAFYSYNNTEQPPVVLTSGTATEDSNGGFVLSEGATIGDNTESYSRNVLFARIENTGVISQMTKLPNILFNPLFCRLSWMLYTEGSENFTVSEAQINGTYSDATVYMNRLQSVSTVQQLWGGKGTADVAVGLSFDETTGSRLVSNRHIFIPDESKATLLSATLMMSTPNAIHFSIDIPERGVSYKVVSRIVPVTTRYRVSFTMESGGVVSPQGMQEGFVGEIKSSIASANSGFVFDGWWDAATNKKIISTTGDVIVLGSKLSVKLSSATDQKSYVAKFSVADIGEAGKGVPRIYVEGTGDNARLMLTQNPGNFGAYFQFGSIKAWSNSGRYPTLIWNGSNNTRRDWDENWSVYVNNLHMVEHLREGKGDPCRLVGYTQKYVNDELKNGRLPDNGKWRLPYSYEFQYAASNSSGWTSQDGINGRDMPFEYEGVKEFMPANGYRFWSGGALTGPGSEGFYWSATAYSTAHASVLRFDSNRVSEEASTSHAYGYSVRCIRQ